MTPDGLLELRKGLRYSRMWFISGGGQPFDVVAALFRDLNAEDDRYTFVYRVRYYAGSSRAGQIRSYRAQVGRSETTSLISVGIVLREFVEEFGMKRDTVMLGTDDPDAILKRLEHVQGFEAIRSAEAMQ